MSEAAAAPEEAAPAGPSKLPMIALLLSTLGTAVAMGMLVYSKMLFKRPEIVESKERVRIKASNAVEAKPATTPGFVQFTQMVLNILPEITEYSNPDGSTGQKIEKLHYAKVNFAMEIADITRQGELETIKAQFTDELIQLLGKKKYEELTTIQGRYLLRSEIAQAANKLIGDPLVLNVYFNSIVVE